MVNNTNTFFPINIYMTTSFSEPNDNNELPVNIESPENVELPENVESHPNIEHLVLSGGGVGLFATYGALRDSAKSGFWKLDTLKSIWGTSAGAIVGGIILLSTDWDTLDNYIIRRPWESVFPINLYTLMNAYTNCGLFNISSIEQLFSPLLLSREFPVNITLNELYENTGIEFHAFSTEINLKKPVDISHITHPRWRLVDAIYASCSVPGLFSPYIHGENVYTDGGVYFHYPLKPCLDKYSSIETIFGVVKHITAGSYDPITAQSTLLDFIRNIKSFLLETLVVEQHNTYTKLLYEIDLGVLDSLTAEGIKNALLQQDERRRLIEHGANAWRTQTFFATI